MQKENELTVFAKNISFLRKKHKLSKGKMACRLNISVQSLNKIESGIIPPRLSSKVVFDVYRAFDILPKDLFRPLFSVQDTLTKK